MLLRRKSITSPLVLPLTLAEAKAHVRQDSTADDALIGDLILAACDAVGDLTWSSIYSQTWEFILPWFPGSSMGLPSSINPQVLGSVPSVVAESFARRGRNNAYAFRLPRGPVTKVESLKYYDVNGTLTTIVEADYQTSQTAEGFLLAPKVGQSWPAVQAGKLEPIIVEFTAGYDGSAQPFPHQAKQAVKMLLAHWYENRETVLVGSISKPIEMAVAQLCRNISFWRFDLGS